jgi:hypothetical protein
MLTKHFHPTSICIERDLEEVLLRICLISSKPPVAVLVFLLEICRRVRPRALPSRLLDVPLTKLLDCVERVLERHPTLSVCSVRTYLGDLRYLLNRFDGRLGATTLRGHLPGGNAAWLAFMVGRVTRRLERVPFHWGARKVFARFIEARHKDVFVFLSARFWLDKESAKEATNDTFERVEQKLRRFDPGRRRLMQFTFGQAWFVMKETVRAFLKRAKQELSLQTGSDTGQSLEEILAAPVSGELCPQRYAVKLRLACLLFGLRKPPHQIIVFILCCLLDRSPLQILDTYSSVPLRIIADEIEREFERISNLPERLVRAGFNRLRTRMNKTLAELIGGQVRRAAYGPLLPRQAGTIPLGEYFRGAGDREKALHLVQAWYSVLKALVTGSRNWRFPPLPPPEPPPSSLPKPKNISPPGGPWSSGAACEGHGSKEKKGQKKSRRPGSRPGT